MAFYHQYLELKKKLEAKGHIVYAPELEFKIAGDDTSVGAYFDRHGGIDAFPPNHEVWKKKGNAILSHFKKIDDSEAILVTNWEKRGQPNYIGANGFLEMGYAFTDGKKIYVLNELPAQSPFEKRFSACNQ